MFWYIVITIIFFILFAKYCERIMKKIYKESKKYGYMYRTAYNWLRSSHDREKIILWFKKKEINSIAMCGIDELGRHLLSELEGTEIEIKFLIDRNTRREIGDYKIYALSDELPEIDTIIVTSVFEFDEIASKLKAKETTKIISLAEVINGLSDV